MSFWIRELPFSLLLILTLLGVAYTSFLKQPLMGYWELLAPVIGLVCVGSGWSNANDSRARLQLMWTQALHWAPRQRSSLLSFGFSLLLQPQNMCAQRIEPLFGDIAEQRILMTGYGRSDLHPILRLKGPKRGRKEISIFHHHVVPLVRDEIANNGIDIVPKKVSIREHVLDRVSDATQAFSPFVVFASEITDLRSRNRIARS